MQSQRKSNVITVSVSLKRRFLTFIELMIVLGLIGLVTSIIGFNLNKTMAQQRFQTETGLVVDVLRLAQNLMLILNEDIHVKFAEKESGKLQFWMEINCSLSEGWDKELPLKPRTLLAIRTIDLLESGGKSKKAESEVDLQFLSGGYVMSEGVLRLSSANSEYERFIPLKGRPGPVEAFASIPIVSKEEGEQSNQLMQFTILEIASKTQQQEPPKKN